MLRDRRSDAAPPAPDRTRARPVVLATMAEGFHPGAERMAIDSAIEAGVPLLVVNLIPLPIYVRTMTLVGVEGDHAPTRGAPGRGPRDGGPRGGARGRDGAPARAYPARAEGPARGGRRARRRPARVRACRAPAPALPRDRPPAAPGGRLPRVDRARRLSPVGGGHARPGAIQSRVYKLVRRRLRPGRGNGGQDLGRRALLGTRLRLGSGLAPDRAAEGAEGEADRPLRGRDARERQALRRRAALPAPQLRDPRRERLPVADRARGVRRAR